MFDNTNHYALRTEVMAGITRYFVHFTDGQSIPQETEVSCDVYLELLRFMKHERNLRRSDERHIEQAELTDETLRSGALYTAKGIEDMIFDSQRDMHLWFAIERLPTIQRRRFVLYHDFGLTYEQIAEDEGCTFQAVAKCIKTAEASVKKYFESQG